MEPSYYSRNLAAELTFVLIILDAGQLSDYEDYEISTFLKT